MHIKLFAATFLALSILLFTHCKQSQKLQQTSSAAGNNKGLKDLQKLFSYWCGCKYKISNRRRFGFDNARI